MALNGNNILVYRDGSLIAGTRSSEIETSVELVEVSSPSDGDWRHYITGRKDWTVTVNFFVAQNGESIETLMTVGTSYTLQILYRDGEGTMTGTAILKSCKVTATKGNLAQGSFQFVGTSALVEATTE